MAMAMAMTMANQYFKLREPGLSLDHPFPQKMGPLGVRPLFPFPDPTGLKDYRPLTPPALPPNVPPSLLPFLTPLPSLPSLPLPLPPS